MATYRIHADLIDGEFMKTFRSMKSVVAYVDSMEDFGDDGRRPWGFQGEFGPFSFEGFSWAEIHRCKNNYYRNHVDVVECQADWKLVEWLPNPVTGYAESAQLFAWAYNATHQGSFFEVRAVMGRYHVTAFDSESQYEDDCGFEIGRYRSMEDVQAAIVRWSLAPKASRFEW